MIKVAARELIAACVAGLLFAPGTMPAANQYLQRNLISDIPEMADYTDSHLVNPWGIAISNTSPFWFADNGSGFSTLYSSAGTGSVPELAVTIPASSHGGATSHPTGIVFNSTSGFAIAPGQPATFIFASADGTISGWNHSVNASQAVVKVDNSMSGAVYTGLATGFSGSSAYLYAANFHSGKIEVYDSNFNLVSPSVAPFTDSHIPAGFAPFNIQNLGSTLYVTYAKQDGPKQSPVPGQTYGYVDLYNTSGQLAGRLIEGTPLNAPWGLAIAPAGFGDFAFDLLVGNFGDGIINVFNPANGSHIGALQDLQGNTIVIPGIWGLQPGNGQSGGDINAVYFTAGIGGSGGAIQSHGLFGSFQAAPKIAAGGVQNAASFGPAVGLNTFVTIFGANLSSTTRTWQEKDFVNGALPTAMDGVSVSINGQPAYIYYISPTQLNVLMPLNLIPGAAQVQTMNNGFASGSAAVTLQSIAPAFFLFANKYVAALHSDNVSLVGSPALFPGVSTPARPGETIVMYGNGFGPTTPATPAGQLITKALNLSTTPVILIGNTQAEVTFAGLTGAGLYQINAVVPPSTPDGDISVIAQAGGQQSPSNVFITVHH